MKPRDGRSLGIPGARIRAWGPRRHLLPDDDWWPVLKAWIRAMKIYTGLSDGDPAWWYGERANVGFLAAALQASDRTALQEFASPKARATHRRTKEGRADLYAIVGGKSYYFEAKSTWRRIRKSLSPGNVLGGWSKAIDDVKRLRRVEQKQDRRARWGAVLFVAPSIQKGDHDKIDDRISSFLEHDFEIGCDDGTAGFRVDYYPSTEDPESLFFEDDECFYPGISMWTGVLLR